MNVGDFLQDLSLGELRNLYVSLDGVGTIADADRDRMVYFANRALTRIYSRFPSRRQFITLKQFDGQTTYPIRKLYTVTDATIGNVANRFIIDSAGEPFAGDLIKIVSVRYMPSDTESDEENLLINGGGARASVKTLTYDTLYFETPIADQTFLLELQLNHPRLTLPADLEEEIIIAPVLVEALALKVAADVYSSMNGADNVGKASVLEAQYEQLAQLIVDQDLLQNSSSDDHTRMSEGGWL